MSLRFVKQGDVYEAQLYRIEPSTSLASKWTVYCGDDRLGSTQNLQSAARMADDHNARHG
jgi:6-phosphogluconolactonase/glucosamine-6-phosphate isomerase/deaminase